MPTRNEESATKAADNQIDFVIVGAGPVGLLAANLIVQAGFSVRIFGKWELFLFYKKMLKSLS